VAHARIGLQLARSLVEQLGDDCAAAAAVAREIEVSPVGARISASVIEQISAGRFLRVAMDFAERGWLTQDGEGWRVLSHDHLPREVSTFLEGAASMRAACTGKLDTIAVVTMPSSPSAIGDALPATGLAYAGLIGTNDAFERVADAARSSLTIMTPFLNNDGLSWAIALFERTPALRRRLIVRGRSSTRRLLEEQRIRIQQAGVEVLSYAVTTFGNAYETFHAKVLLADGAVAYVGSANLLGYARQSMELGILTSGRAALAVAGVVRAVEAVASPILLP